MQVRMWTHLLIPCVQHREEADLRSQAVRVGGNGEQRFRGRSEQHVVNQFWILQRQSGKLTRQRKHGMTVRHGQELLGRPCQPLVTRCGLALCAMPISAGVELQCLMRTVVALFQACATGGSSTCADVAECLALLGRERIAPAGKEFLFVLTKDIGDFQPMSVHLWRPSSSERSMGFNSRASKGLRIACSRCMDTRRYLAVVRMSACPSRT